MLAARGAEAILHMILVDGFFHADPHPGNVFFLPGNRIVMIDFGMVGRLAPRRRREVVDLLAGLAQMEEEPMLDVLLDWAGDAYVDEARLAADINELVFEYESIPLASIRIGALVRRFAAIVREHSIVLPADLTLMFKALITMEGLGRQYDPEFHIVEHLDAAAAQRAARALPPGRARASRAQRAGRVPQRRRQRSARHRAAAARGAARQDAHRPRHEAPRQLRPAARRDARPRHDGHHDRVAGDRLVDRDDGHRRAHDVRHSGAGRDRLRRLYASPS